MNQIPRQKPVWREYLDSIIIALVLALFIRAFLVQAFKIPSGSMLETLLIGDHLLVNKFIYGTRIPFTNTYVFQGQQPERGDIIVFKYPRNPSIDYIKRIVGIPGDKLMMRDKVLYHNGQALQEPYVRHTPTSDRSRDNFAELTVPENHYFAMGDNRDESADSREWGFVHKDAIHGKAWRIYWSWASLSDIRWSRIGRALQ